MTKKRRMFDIDLPDDIGEGAEVPAAVSMEAAPETKSFGARRGPMATAIGETADAVRRRRLQEAAIRDENDALAHEFVRLKKLGLITDLIPIDRVYTTKLTRDRAMRLDLELDDLKASIKAVGLSNPIQVEPLDFGFELVQGWRRLSAFKALYEETRDTRFAVIPAVLLAKGETLENLYRRMVDENMVRKDVSWAEMARLAQAYADDPNTDCADVDQAVNVLYASASPQKRSYIRRFALLMRMMEKVLNFPEAIPRALGLEVANRLEADLSTAGELSRTLRHSPRNTPEEEMAALRAFAESRPAISPRGNQGRGRPAKRGKTTLRLPIGTELVKCTASPGRVELRLDRDFSAVDRGRLEAAVEAFFRAMDGA